MLGINIFASIQANKRDLRNTYMKDMILIDFIKGKEAAEPFPDNRASFAGTHVSSVKSSDVSCPVIDSNSIPFNKKEAIFFQKRTEL